MALFRTGGKSDEILPYAAVYGNNNNQGVALIEPDGTATYAINGTSINDDLFTATATPSAVSITAKVAGTYRVVSFAHAAPTPSDVVKNANEVIWSFSGQYTGTVVVTKID